MAQLPSAIFVGDERYDIALIKQNAHADVYGDTIAISEDIPDKWRRQALWTQVVEIALHKAVGRGVPPFNKLVGNVANELWLMLQHPYNAEAVAYFMENDNAKVEAQGECKGEDAAAPQTASLVEPGAVGNIGDGLHASRVTQETAVRPTVQGLMSRVSRDWPHYPLPAEPQAILASVVDTMKRNRESWYVRDIHFVEACLASPEWFHNIDKRERMANLYHTLVAPLPKPSSDSAMINGK
jgi:hypothetical protein